MSAPLLTSAPTAPVVATAACTHRWPGTRLLAAPVPPGGRPGQLAQPLWRPLAQPLPAADVAELRPALQVRKDSGCDVYYLGSSKDCSNLLGLFHVGNVDGLIKWNITVV